MRDQARKTGGAMRRFVVIATANRGAVDPPEALDGTGQCLANLEAEKSDAADAERLRVRATRGFRLERDAPMSRDELRRLARPVVAERPDFERGIGRSMQAEMAR
jgi:hypothetical protein